MIKAIDFPIFGSGRGLSAPYFAMTFYWLPYTIVGQERRLGTFYTFMSGFGAQLHSYQWTHPNAGERRRIKGRVFEPLSSSRRWGRVEVAWSTKLPSDIDEANATLRQIKMDLSNPVIDV